MNKTILFLKDIDTLWKKEIPLSVITRAKQSLLDYLAVTVAGAAFQKEKLNRYTAFARPENGDITVIGTRQKLALKEAVFLNGMNSHALDFDDGTNSGIIHLGSPVFSLLLPLAERYDISVDALLRAAVIGYETSYTMALSIQPGHKALGYHATGTCGVLGAAMAASYMLEFTEEERFQSFAVACVSASGMLKVLDDESELKPYNVAKTSLLALTSIQLVKSGFKGNHDPLGGRGFFRMMTGKEDVDIKPVLFGGTYAIMKTYTKPYASCRYTHPAVEAAIRMGANVRPDEVEHVDIKTYSLAVPGHDHTEIPSSYSAKMSIPFATAVGLLYRKAGLQEFSETSVRNEEVLALTKKIHVESDEQLSRLFPEMQPAVVCIKKIDGTMLTDRVDYPKGEPQNPMSGAEFRERYDRLMGYAGVKSEVSNNIFDLISSGVCSVRDLMKDI